MPRALRDAPARHVRGTPHGEPALRQARGQHGGYLGRLQGRTPPGSAAGARTRPQAAQTTDPAGMSLLIQSLASVVSSCGHGACGCASLPTSQTGPRPCRALHANSECHGIQTSASAADRVKHHGHGARPWPCPRSQSAAVNLASRGRRLAWKPVTESNLSLNAPAHTTAHVMRASLGLLGIRQRRAEQGDLCSHAYGRHGCSMPVVPKRGRLASGSAAGQATSLGRTGRPGLAIGDRRADGGCQTFPARWIFRVGTFRLRAAGSRDAASRACRSHATVTTILPRVWPCSTVRRPSAVSARG
jgi:hypothetical protein